MPAGRKRKPNTKECPTCGHSNSCRVCVEEYKAALKAERRIKDREQRAKYVAMGLNGRGQPRKIGWKAGPSLVLSEKITPILDEECFEAPDKITKRELEFLI